MIYHIIIVIHDCEGIDESLLIVVMHGCEGMLFIKMDSLTLSVTCVSNQSILQWNVNRFFLANNLMCFFCIYQSML